MLNLNKWSLQDTLLLLKLNVVEQINFKNKVHEHLNVPNPRTEMSSHHLN